MEKKGKFGIAGYPQVCAPESKGSQVLGLCGAQRPAAVQSLFRLPGRDVVDRVQAWTDSDFALAGVHAYVPAHA